MKQKNNENGIALKKIEIIREELNPIVENNLKNKISIGVFAPSSFGKLQNLKPLDDRIFLDFFVEDSLDSDTADEIHSVSELDKFRKDLREIFDKSTKVRLIETKKKKPILIIFSPFIDSTLEDKCLVFASENKDLEDFIDMLILIGYSKLEIK